jgi:hypothetical protein
MGSELGSQATVAVLVSFAIQWIKKSSAFPWLTIETHKLNTLVSVIVAFASGFGIFATWDHGTLAISGLTGVNLAHALTRIVQQWTFQHVAYRTVIAPPLPGAIQQPDLKETSPHVS